MHRHVYTTTQTWRSQCFCGRFSLAVMWILRIELQLSGMVAVSLPDEPSCQSNQSEVIFFLLTILGIKPTALHMQDKCSTTKL